MALSTNPAQALQHLADATAAASKVRQAAKVAAAQLAAEAAAAKAAEQPAPPVAKEE